MRHSNLIAPLLLLGILLGGCDPRGTYFRAKDGGAGSPVAREPSRDAGADAGAVSGADAGAGAGAGVDAGYVTIRERCFPGVGDPTKGLPNYDQFGPTVPNHCAGTGHQLFDSIQKVVFLGDSITAGTPPTAERDYYRLRLTRALEARYGTLESKWCAAWGATTERLLGGDRPQIPTCFPSIETKRVLVVMTVGGNDMVDVAHGALAGDPMSASLARVDRIALRLREAVDWFATNANRFQNGVRIVFANVYEYTDATGDLPICAVARVIGGLTRAWPEGRLAYLRLSEGYMKIAVETRTDMVFLLETFCGHGFKSDDPANECYRGAGAERWIDLTCIHPTPVGHARIAELFMNVVSGSPATP